METTEPPNPPFPPGYGPRPVDRVTRRLSRAQGRVLDVLQAQEAPVALAALSAETGLHPNTLREHLVSLQAAGLVLRRRATPDGPGRPAWAYAAVADAGGVGVAEYAGLATTLAAVIHRTSRDPRRDAVAAGREWGRDLAESHGRPVETSAVAVRREVVALFDEIGFAPEPDHRARDVRLTRCPLLDSALRYPDVVCAVHLGIAQGALEEYGGDAADVGLQPFSEPGACRLHLAPPPVGSTRE